VAIERNGKWNGYSSVTGEFIGSFATEVEAFVAEMIDSDQRLNGNALKLTRAVVADSVVTTHDGRTITLIEFDAAVVKIQQKGSSK
jgi:hypothetical protein